MGRVKDAIEEESEQEGKGLISYGVSGAHEAIDVDGKSSSLLGLLLYLLCSCHCDIGLAMLMFVGEVVLIRI